MMFLYGGGSGSPIAARQTAPIFLIILVLSIIIGFLIVLAIIYKKYKDYLSSDKFLQKEMNRKTRKSDISKMAKQNNLTPSDENILWSVCQVTECTNIVYLLKSNIQVNEIFRNAYNLMKEQQMFTDQILNDFFVCLFKMELMVAQTKKVLSTTQIPEDSIIFYISEEGEQLPFTVLKNTKDFFVTSIPEHLVNSPRKPQLLVRSRFTFKTVDGLSYNFISRLIRYEKTNDDKTTLIIAHTDQLQCQAQRHFKREFFAEKCFFAPVQINPKPEKGKSRFILAPKAYEGKLSNISGGGCCIQTPLPIKEKQYISVSLKPMGINEKVIGIIRSTRKLPTGLFALHIQFEEISLQTKNKIYTLVYKYEL